MKKTMMVMALALLAVGFVAVEINAQAAPAAQMVPAVPSWVPEMKKVHQNFKGTPNFVALYGDLVNSMAFWSVVGWSNPDEFIAGEGMTGTDGLPKRPADKRWRDVILGHSSGTGKDGKDPEFRTVMDGNKYNMTIAELLAVIDSALQKNKPEVALIMIGVNDTSSPDYAKNLDQIVEKCIKAGCIPVLNTIPLLKNEKLGTDAVNAAIKQAAAKYNVPLADVNAEFAKLGAYTLNPEKTAPSAGATQNFSADNLAKSGFAVMTWLDFQLYRQIYFLVLHPVK